MVWNTLPENISNPCPTQFTPLKLLMLPLTSSIKEESGDKFDSGQVSMPVVMDSTERATSPWVRIKGCKKS